MKSEKKTSAADVLLRMAKLIKPLSGYMAGAVALGLAGNLCATFITVTGAWSVLRVAGYISAPLALLFILLILMAIARGFLRYSEQKLNHYIAFRLLALIRGMVFQALRRLCPAKLEGRDKGDLISLITSDIELLEVFYAHTVSPLLIAALYTIIMCLFIGHYGVIYGLYALIAYIIVGVLIPYVTNKTAGDAGEEYRRQSGELAAFVLDSLRGLGELLQYGRGKARLDELNEKTDELASANSRLKDITAINTAVSDAVILLLDLGMLLLTLSGCRSGTLSFGGCLICTVAMMSSFGPATALAALGATLQNTVAAGERVLEIIDDTPVTADIENGINLDASAEITAEADDVTFSYGGETVLSGLSMSAVKGGITGIVGKSGSGKSTLLRLMMRFWDVNGGTVSIGATDVRQINTASLRDCESFVTQDTHLFHDSISANLRISKPDATDTEIEDACRKASIHDFIMTLPKGYDTPVGELGDTLSGGERQRLGLARAFLHNSPLMLLDEPTSNLDSLNEAVILKSVGEEKGHRTVVMVSHRASSVRIADKVVTVDGGRVS